MDPPDTQYTRGYFAALCEVHHAVCLRLKRKVPEELLRQIREIERQSRPSRVPSASPLKHLSE